MADPTLDNILEKRAAFATNFLGTTNLAQRRRYQEDIQAADDAAATAAEAQFSRANRRAELADPLKARTVQLNEQKALAQQSQFQNNLTFKEKQMALQEQKFALDQKKADYAIRKAMREQADAERILADTDAVEQADFDLRQAGFQPSSKPYAAGMLAAFAAHPHIDPNYRRTMWQAAEIEDDPDETMSRIQKDMKDPVVTAYVNPEGKARYVVRERYQEEVDPLKKKRELERDLDTASKRVLIAAPEMKPYWNKRIQETNAALLKLDQPAENTSGATPAGNTAPAPAPIKLKLVDGKLVPPQ